MKPGKGKTWTDKVNAPAAYQVKPLEKAFADMQEGEMMLIATPKIIDEYVREIPPGHKVDIKTLRKDLALAYHAEDTCPLTTGIFLRIVSEAALEQLAAGQSADSVAPFWRAVDPKSPLAKKLSCGPDFVARMRAEEKP